MLPHYWLLVHHELGFVRVERIVDFMGVEFIVVQVVVDSGGLTKSAYLLKTRSLQLCLLWSGFGQRARGVACSR